MRNRWLKWFVLLVVIAVAGGGYYWYSLGSRASESFKTSEEKDVYVRFTMEAYDKIAENYWNKAKDSELAELFRLSLQKAANTGETLATTTRAGVAHMLKEAFSSATSTDAKKQLAVNTTIVALFNLAPQGRNGLLSQVQEKQLREEVSNIDRSKDLYQDLGLPKGTTTQAVEQAYQEKKTELEHATSTQAKEQLKTIAYAHQVLTAAETKARYDQAQIEPTVFSHKLGKTLYLYVSKIAPTTLQEFGNAIDATASNPNLDSMILDFRGNIGGSLDFTQAFLGVFIGPNQYAFDLFHQGDYQAQRTTLPKVNVLSRFKEIAILTDNMTQSTAELTAAAFKRFRLGRVVGTATRGWGTVENTYPIATEIDPSTKYSLLLVNSITLRDDNQPIEGRGVEPDVDIKSAQWKREVAGLFTSSSLITALQREADQPPLR